MQNARRSFFLKGRRKKSALKKLIDDLEVGSHRGNEKETENEAVMVQ